MTKKILFEDRLRKLFPIEGPLASRCIHYKEHYDFFGGGETLNDAALTVEPQLFFLSSDREGTFGIAEAAEYIKGFNPSTIVIVLHPEGSKIELEKKDLDQIDGFVVIGPDEFRLERVVTAIRSFLASNSA